MIGRISIERNSENFLNAKQTISPENLLPLPKYDKILKKFHLVIMTFDHVDLKLKSSQLRTDLASLKVRWALTRS